LKTIFYVCCDITIITIIITAIQYTIGNFSQLDSLYAGPTYIVGPIVLYIGIEEITDEPMKCIAVRVDVRGNAPMPAILRPL
jgi:hypothetical protein